MGGAIVGYGSLVSLARHVPAWAVAGRNIYASPTGLSTNDGSIGSPYDLPTALTQQAVGDVLYLRGGVYTVADGALVMGPLNSGTRRSVISAYPGERPVITNSTASPPVTMRPYLTLNGLWFGGPKATSNDPVLGNDGKLVANCTFWNYYGCLTDGDSVNNAYMNNRLINCSGGNMYHDQYISRAIFASGQGGPIHQGNIHLSSGGPMGGYQTQLWHYPTNATVRGNFYGDAAWGLAVQGQSHLIRDNIFWSCVQRIANWSNDGGPGKNPEYTVTHNLFGHGALGAASDWNNTGYPLMIANKNTFVRPKPIPDPSTWAIPNGWYTFGDSPVSWDTPDFLTNMGIATTAVDAAISALETAFGQTPTQIQADTTIEGNFTILRNLLNTWAALP